MRLRSAEKIRQRKVNHAMAAKTSFVCERENNLNNWPMPFQEGEKKHIEAESGQIERFRHGFI